MKPFLQEYSSPIATEPPAVEHQGSPEATSSATFTCVLVSGQLTLTKEYHLRSASTRWRKESIEVYVEGALPVYRAH